MALAGCRPRRLVQPGTNRGRTGGKGIIPKDGRDGERRRAGGRAAGDEFGSGCLAGKRHRMTLAPHRW